MYGYKYHNTITGTHNSQYGLTEEQLLNYLGPMLLKFPEKAKFYRIFKETEIKLVTRVTLQEV